MWELDWVVDVEVGKPIFYDEKGEEFFGWMTMPMNLIQTVHRLSGKYGLKRNRGEKGRW